MINRMITFLTSVYKENPYALLINGVLFLAISIFVFQWMKYEQDHNRFAKFIAKAKADLQEQERLRRIEYEKQFELEGSFQDKNKFRKISTKLEDSGLKEKYPELVAETYIIAHILIAIVGGTLIYFITKSMLASIIGCIVTYFLINIWLEIKIIRNFNRIENEIVKFINLLENVSHSEENIADILMSTTPYIKEPLKSSVEKCYYEIKSTGNTSIALQHLCDRTNHKQLKMVFASFKSCSIHNEEYEQVIQENRDNILNYINFRKQKAQIKKSSLLDMTIMAAAGIMIIAILSTMVDNAMYYLFETLIGQVIITAGIIVYAYGVWLTIKND